MLPFSKYLHKMSPYTQTPIISVWVNVLFCACLGLIDLASYTAISAIFNVTLPLPSHVGLDLTFVGLRHCNGLELLHPNPLQNLLASKFHSRTNSLWPLFLVH